MAIDKLLSNIEVLIEAPGGIVKLRDLIRSLGVSGALNGLDASAWRKTTIGSEVKIVRGITFPASAKKRSPGKGLLPCLRTANIQDEVVWDDLIYVPDDYLKNVDQFVVVDDLLISMANSRELVGKVALVRRDDIKCTLGGFIAAIRCGEAIRPNYLLALLRLSSSRERLMDSATQTTNIANISLGRLRPFEIFLPSLEHQDLIVLKIEELMTLCDQLEERKNQRDKLRTAARESATNAISTAQTPEELDAAWRRISDNWEVIADRPESVESLRRLVLWLAVCGELTPQIPGDGNSEHLAAEFEANQRKMVREEIILNPRFQRGLTIKEVPYEIPDSWRWYYLGEVGAVVGGGTPSTSVSSYWSNGESIPWLTPADMRKQTSRYISRGTRDITEKGLAESSAQLLPLGTVLFSSRAPIGHVGIAAQPLATNQGFKSCIPYVSEMSEYIFVFLLHIGPEIDAQATGTTFKEVSGKQVSQILIPVPPLAEQKRIVSKVDEIMALCDQLEAELKVRSEIAEKFARSILEVV